MDHDPNSVDNLQERKNILIAHIMTSFRDLVNLATAPIDNTASTGQAAYSSMALETMMSEIIKSTEDLLSLTRKIRELWLIGPLKAPGAHDAQADQEIRQDAEQVISMLNTLRDNQRQKMLQAAAASGGGFTYEKGEVDGPAPPLQHPATAGEDVEMAVEGAGADMQGQAQAQQQQVVSGSSGQRL